jgi:nucleoside-diphosphate-sugar epimerase
MARIFLAGASGVIGRSLTRMLLDARHEVTGTSRNADGVARLESIGAHGVVVDALDRDGLVAAVRATAPEVVIHQLTSLAGAAGGVTDEILAANARLRKEGTANLVEAAAAVGARRVIAQSIAWLYGPGPEPHLEDEPLLVDDPATRVTASGVVELERLVTTDPRFDGIVLRYGRLYGPGTWTAAPDTPPTVHVDDAARAAMLAIDHGEPGIYHIAEPGSPVSTDRAATLLGWMPTRHEATSNP